MRFLHLTVAVATVALSAGSALFAADLKIPPRAVSKDFPVQKAPPNCDRWTDECVNCSRGGDGEPSICSNVGFACQPQAVRCLSPAIPRNEK